MFMYYVYLYRASRLEDVNRHANYQTTTFKTIEVVPSLSLALIKRRELTESTKGA